jgi:poly-beta-1,6-N-acetyl-D-glucosamine synthase
VIYFIILCVLSYVVFSIYLMVGWNNIAFSITNIEKNHTHTVAVILPVRNECNHIELILENLLVQNYPKELYHVYLADDGSTDGTEAILKKWIQTYPDTFKWVEQQAAFLDWKGKKKMIASAIAQTNAEYILTTDADCMLLPTWIRSMVDCLESSVEVQFVSGPVKMIGPDTFWSNFQKIEFLSLVGSGASAIGLKKPLMCNGANVAYLKSSYIKVSGFEGNETIASGDDEFLMHKITAQFSKKAVVFCKNVDAIVATHTADSWAVFYNQRKRWAGKWTHYRLKYVQAVALFVFGFHLTIVISSILVLLNQLDWYYLLILWGTKALFDYFYLKSVARFLSNDFKKSIFISAVLIYPLYVVGFGIISRLGSYTWKERIEKLS